jgi:hypothetical protein
MASMTGRARTKWLRSMERPREKYPMFLYSEEFKSGSGFLLVVGVRPVSRLTQSVWQSFDLVGASGRLVVFFGRSDRPLEVRLGELSQMENKVVDTGTLDEALAQGATIEGVSRQDLQLAVNHFMLEAVQLFPSWNEAAMAAAAEAGKVAGQG